MTSQINQNSVFDNLGEYQIRILFKGWYTQTVWQFILSCCGIFSFCLLYHLVKWGRENIKTNMYCKGFINDEERTSFINKDKMQSDRCSSLFVFYILSIFYWSIGTLLLLCLTTFNMWICLSVVLGYSTGEIIFFMKILNLKMNRR